MIYTDEYLSYDATNYDEFKQKYGGILQKRILSASLLVKELYHHIRNFPTDESTKYIWENKVNEYMSMYYDVYGECAIYQRLENLDPIQIVIYNLSDIAQEIANSHIDNIDRNAVKKSIDEMFLPYQYLIKIQ